MRSMNFHNSGMAVIMSMIFFYLTIIATHSASGGTLCNSKSWSGKIEYQYDKTSVQALIEKLKDSGDIAKVPRDFFGDLYNSKLVDMVAFFGPDGNYNVALLEECTHMKELFGERNVYLTLFAVVPESDITLVTATSNNSRKPVTALEVRENSIDTIVVYPDTITVSLTAKVSHSQLDYRRGAGERSVQGIISALISVLGFNPKTDEKGVTVQDTKFEVKDWRILYRGPLYDEKKTMTVIYSYQKIPIHENTINGIAVRMPGRKADLYARFGNYSSSHIGASIGLMASASEMDSNYGSDTLYNYRPGFKPFFTKMEAEPFFFIHLYMIPPRLPALDRNHPTLSVVAGSKIDFSEFPVDLFFGVGLGHIKGSSFHLLAGWNFARFKTQSGIFYKGEPMFGLSYGL